jgi:hypothetical protein
VGPASLKDSITTPSSAILLLVLGPSCDALIPATSLTSFAIIGEIARYGVSLGSSRALVDWTECILAAVSNGGVWSRIDRKAS